MIVSAGLRTSQNTSSPWKKNVPAANNPRMSVPGDFESVPPPSDLLVIRLDDGDVRERNLEPAAQRPQFAQTLDGEDRAVAFNRHVDHRACRYRSYTGFLARRGQRTAR